ncbi:hypothetical protein OBBRIDRAFT_643392 [Obba rivulosa]|uniref:Uncharacterized protein n=1 Tax=Obba rivulosa TaxID=1052685 RepID=A0A8E2J5D7_9APHY|nr:hypothetical protein OBBRIDRAFT_643392 [Obba rivulosa]
MHRCLQTVDTLLLILQYFKAHDGLPITQNTSALSALARTCRAFCDLALDLLWENQWTLVNLVRCLPADAWRIDIEEHMEVGNDGAIPKPPEGSVVRTSYVSVDASHKVFRALSDLCSRLTGKDSISTRPESNF